jgi:hypothetical protein
MNVYICTYNIVYQNVPAGTYVKFTRPATR